MKDLLILCLLSTVSIVVCYQSFHVSEETFVTFQHMQRSAWRKGSSSNFYSWLPYVTLLLHFIVSDCPFFRNVGQSDILSLSSFRSLYCDCLTRTKESWYAVSTPLFKAMHVRLQTTDLAEQSART